MPDENPFSKYANQPAPPPADSAPADAPAADDNPFKQYGQGGSTQQQEQAPAQQPADDYQHNVSIIRGMLASDAPRPKVKDAIMTFAAAHNMIGPQFEGDIDNALSYRDRAGHTAAARDTAFENVVPDNTTPITITGQRIKPRPNGISQEEATVVGALESVPGADRIGAAVDAGLNELNPYSKDGFSDHYTKTLNENRALSDQAWDEQPGSYGYGYALGVAPQMLIGTGEIDAAANAPRLAGTVARGAAFGGGASLANTRQDLSTGEGWQNAGEHAVVDASLGAGLGLVTHGATSLSTKGYNAAGPEVIDAANRLSRDGLNVQPSVATTAGPVLRGASGVAENVPWIGAPVRSRMGKFGNQVETAFNRTADEASANGASQPMTATAKDLLDPNVKGSLASYEPTAKAALGPQYDAIDQQAANVMVKPVKTLSYLDSAIAQQKARFRGDKADWLPVIEDIRNDVAKGDIPFNNLRDYRTSIRDELQQRLGDGWRNMAPAARRNVEGILDGIYANATDDIHQALRVSGLRDASQALRGVDAQYAQVANTAKSLQPLLGLSPEQLAPKLEQLAQDRGGNSGQLSNIMKTMSPDQQRNLQASFVYNLGLPNAGAGAGEGFSANSFLTRWGGDGVRGGMSNDAKNLLFTGQTRRDLDDLATLARAQRRYYQQTGNPSGTARNVIGFEEAKAAFGTGQKVATGAASIGSALVLPLLGYVSSHMLASPGLARALVNLGRGGEGYTAKFARRMEVLARRNPDAATQFLGLRDAVLGNQHPNKVKVGSRPDTQSSGDAVRPEDVDLSGWGQEDNTDQQPQPTDTEDQQQ